VFEGQHPAIINPEIWGRVQKLLETDAARERGTKQLAAPSPLIGKLFDDTGDRLTPSHSRKNGKRLRYYISRRLVVDRRAKHPDAWRLPAEQLESLIPEVGSDASKRSNGLIDTRPDGIRRRIARHANQALEQTENRVIYRISVVQNIVKAQRWLSMILDGKSFAEIAEQDQTTSHRIRLVTDLALLAPDILDAIASGTQPDDLNTDRLIKMNISPIWSDQRDVFIKT